MSKNNGRSCPPHHSLGTLKTFYLKPIVLGRYMEGIPMEIKRQFIFAYTFSPNLGAAIQNTTGTQHEMTLMYRFGKNKKVEQLDKTITDLQQQNKTLQESDPTKGATGNASQGEPVDRRVDIIFTEQAPKGRL